MGMLACIPLWANADEKLSGTVIGTLESVDYSNGQQSTTVNSREKAFDGNPNTFFASYERNYTWTGLDLGSPHIITKVGWMPRNDGLGPKRVQLGVFEGSNRVACWQILNGVRMLAASEIMPDGRVYLCVEGRPGAYSFFWGMTEREMTMNGGKNCA